MSAAAVSNALLVAAGGALGCLCRYCVQTADFLHIDKYYYTIGINITGCLLMGILWSIFSRYGVGAGWRSFLLTGLLGGYTTYSAFSLEGLLLLHDRLTMRFLFYVLMTFFGGFAACAAGLFGTEKLLKFIG